MIWPLLSSLELNNNTSHFMRRTRIYISVHLCSIHSFTLTVSELSHRLFLLFDKSCCWTHTHPVNRVLNGLKCFFFRGLKPKMSTLIFSSSFNNSCWGSSASLIRLCEEKQLQQQPSLQLSDVSSCFCSRRCLLPPWGGIKSNFPDLPLLSRPPTHSHTPSAGSSGASSWSRWSCSPTALAAGWWAPARRGSATGDRSGSPSGWTSAPPAAPAAPGDAAGGGSAGLSPVLYGKTWGTKEDRRKAFIICLLYAEEAHFKKAPCQSIKLKTKQKMEVLFTFWSPLLEVLTTGDQIKHVVTVRKTIEAFDRCSKHSRCK